MNKLMLNNSIQKAYLFAKEAHKGQTRLFSEKPYIVHPVAVACLVESTLNKFDRNILDSERGKGMLKAALLHDTIEDTKVKYEDILRKFGRQTADLVNELTNVKDDEDALIRQYGRIGEAMYLSRKMLNMSNDALLVKLADRLCNLNDAKKGDANFFRDYINETIYVAKILENRMKKESKAHRLLFGKIRDIANAKRKKSQCSHKKVI